MTKEISASRWVQNGAIVFGLLCAAFLIGVPAGVGYSTDPIADGEVLRQAPPPLPFPLNRPCRTGARCDLERHTLSTERFLRNRKTSAAQPYAPEPRPLTPLSELVRLNIDTQALGYLNLYIYYKDRYYLNEAASRLDYILSQGDAALQGAAFDGQIGYSFLLAAQLTNNPQYKSYGLMLADRCLAMSNNVLNWGFMCALNLGSAYAITNDTKYSDAIGPIVAATKPFQFPDGAFPHNATIDDGKSTGYSAWLDIEMHLVRRYVRSDPNLEFMILKLSDFLKRRVNTDGSINYEDALGSYHQDTGHFDGRGWTADMPSIAFSLMADGYSDLAYQALDFLYSWELSGENQGAYPDKWAFPDPSLWTSGNPSILRTSLNFWYMSAILNIKNPDRNGRTSSCTVSSDNCHPTFAEFNLCSSGMAGTRVVVDGFLTACILPPSAIDYQTVNCAHFSACIFDGEMTDAVICTGPGLRGCIGDVCQDICYPTGNVINQVCERQLFQGDVCAGRPPV